jgi:formylglycine-generating enzyme required for sulfatase activity
MPITPTPPTFDELRLEIQKVPGAAYRARLSIEAQTYNPGWAVCDASLWNHASGRPEWIGSFNHQADGARIFNWLTQDALMANAWSQASLLAPQRRIRLELDENAPELAGVPWELLFSNGTWTAGASASPFSRLLVGGFDPAGPIQERPLHILVAISNPPELADQLAPIDEPTFWGGMVTATQDLVDAGQVQLHLLPGPVTLEKLDAELRKGYHMLHFVGHGAYHANKALAVVYLRHENTQKDYVPAADFAAMIGRGIQDVKNLGKPFLRLVTLTSCQSAVGSLLNALSSVAQQLGQQGLPAVLAMQDLVGMKPALEFTTSFYQQLLVHGLVDLAANEARQTLLTAQSGDAHVPVIFSRLKNNQLLEAVPFQPPKARQPYEPELVRIPAGRFYMGAAPNDALAEAWEKPGSWLEEGDLPPFWIGKYPVTNQEYYEFIQQSNHPAPKLNWSGQQPEPDKLRHPVAGVSWQDAYAYCQWLSAQTGRHYHLPSEAQWEKAARGGQDQRIYPWGDLWQADRCHIIAPDPNQPDRRPEFYTMAVDHYPPQSPYGCFDLVGNLREWTTTLWGDRLHPEKSLFHYPWKADGRDKTETAQKYFKAYRVYRGGGAIDDPAQMRCSARDWDDLDATYMCGFRVARER